MDKAGQVSRTVARRGRGFTIAELLIVVAVAAILAAIAVPIYSQYLVRGQRSAARAVLLQQAQVMERFYTGKGSYPWSTDSPLANFVNGTTNCIGVVPLNSTVSAGATYCISGQPSGTATAVSGYTLSATPCGATSNCGTGANTSFNDPDCGVLTLDNTGTRGATVGGTPLSGTALARCWGS